MKLKTIGKAIIIIAYLLKWVVILLAMYYAYIGVYDRAILIYVSLIYFEIMTKK